ncbi:MAG: hypothetical protein P1P64_02815 [Treponemataceae bacterium]
MHTKFEKKLNLTLKKCPYFSRWSSFATLNTLFVAKHRRCFVHQPAIRGESLCSSEERSSGLLKREFL